MAGKWKELFVDSAGYAQGKCDASEPAQKAEVQEQRRKESQRDDERTERQRQLDYCITLVKKGLVGKAASFLHSQGTAPVTADTAGKLQGMQFPARPNQRNSLDEARAHKPSRNVLTTEQELDAIRKAPRGSAMGPPGWHFEHIKAAAEHEAGRKGACIMIGRIANGEFGKCPSTREDFRIISGARLIAIANGEKIRPKNGPALLDALVSVTWHPFTHHENREQVTNCQLKSEPRRARLAVVFNV